MLGTPHYKTDAVRIKYNRKILFLDLRLFCYLPPAISKSNMYFAVIMFEVRRSAKAVFVQRLLGYLLPNTFLFLESSAIH